MSQPDTTHILFAAIPAWGHTRPFCILAARLVNENENFVVTMIVGPQYLNNARSEISAEFGDEVSESVRRRIRVLSTILPPRPADALEFMKPLTETYASAYQALSQATSISCAVEGTVFDAVSAPAAVILDFVALPLLHATRAITGHSVPIMAWVTGHASWQTRICGPESLGGIGDLGAKIDAEAARIGVTPKEVGDKIYRRTNGEIFKMPGIPDMYDYETFPQKLPWDFPVSWFIRDCYAFLRECDVNIMASAYAFEKESLEAMESWFSDWKKETYVIGPLLPIGNGSAVRSSQGATDIEAFLEKMLIQQGKNSVLFMSFGTSYWTSAPEYVDEVIEALIEKNFPFIFSVASPVGKISDDLAEKVNSSGLGMLTRWAPQQFILNHPATGWFLTHCGQSSVMEALGSGIPMIVWPFDVDQPAAAARLSHNLNIAFELIEVRTGEAGLRPLYRNGRTAKGTREAVGLEIREVIDACRGKKGEEMRRNAEDMKLKFGEAWREDGVSRKELRAFLDKYL